MISESRSKVILNLHIAARPYYSPMGSSFYPSYYPVFPPPSQADYYLPDQQQGDESSPLFRSGSEPRFFGLKKAALSGLISALRGPPGIASLTLFLCMSNQFIIMIFYQRPSRSSSPSPRARSGSRPSSNPSWYSGSSRSSWPTRRCWPNRCYRICRTSWSGWKRWSGWTSWSSRRNWSCWTSRPSRPSRSRRSRR
jgi:hypothetical protein